MKAFGTYVKTLEQLCLRAATRSPVESVAGEIRAALDGEAARQLRRVIPRETLRATGSFFTGSQLATKVAERLAPTLTQESRILDPACGAGDLLLACAKQLPIRRGFRETIIWWGKRLWGRDLQAEFVAAARARLALAAVSRGLTPPARTKGVFGGAFSGIDVGCGRRDRAAIKGATHIVINPPFNLILAPRNCDWSSGLVSAAAVFLEACVRHARSGTRIVAILPDVLRSGERYRSWRRRITAKAQIASIELLGQFDRWADIDVFIAEFVVTSRACDGAGQWEHPVQTIGETVGDHFGVRVGAVVPFRLTGRGPWRPYLHARTVPAWGVMEQIDGRLRFEGSTHSPPFVVLRRTSRLGDRHRAIGTVITGTKPVAVENHLLVLTPKDGRMETCRELLAALQRPETDTWLNQRIRCRHLTVGAVRDLPHPKKA
jgi:hypothetical protein